MELSLYKTKDAENVINKDLILIDTMNISLKNTVEVVNPVIILKESNTSSLLNCNYCFIDGLERYYFIRDIELMDKNMYRLTLECDVLESFKNDILNGVVRVNRKMKDGDYYSRNLENEVIRTIDTYRSDVTLNDTKNIILSTIGG